MKQTIVHIGLPKTGTTLLQRQLFPQHPQLSYLGRCRPLFRRAESSPEYQSCLKGVLAQLANAEQLGLTPVVSYEVICKGPIETVQERVKRIRSIFGECRIMIMLRNPFRLIQSLYMQRMRAIHTQKSRCWGRRLRFQPFSDWIDSEWNESGHLSYLAYEQSIRCFNDEFGENAIGVFLFEKLREDNRRFVETVCRFMEVDSNEEIIHACCQVENRRWSNNAFERLNDITSSRLKSFRFRFATKAGRQRMLDSSDPYPMKPALANARQSTTEIPAGLHDQIQEYTRPGNRFLSEHWSLPLSEYGYPT